MAGEQRRGMWAMIKEGYEGLVMTVIRPLRARYSIEDLGPKHALIHDVVTHRVDLQLKNEGGYTLECSWWKPKTMEKDAKLPCIVILHGNSSCRLGGLEIVTHAIPAGFSVFALDFAGSGLSEGKYVSLGYHEQSDIATVVEYLRKTEETSSICLWGRSMGAVAALLYAQTDPQINAMVLDSPFSSLPRLATELVDDGKLGVPKIAVKLVMRLIRRDIKNRAKFDMFKLKPIAKVNKCTIPAFFVVGNRDELVGPHHVIALYKLHNGPNQLFKFPGGHNSPRPNDFFVQATQFLRVMIGLMPLHLETMASSNSPDASPKKKKKKPLKVFKNPLANGETIEKVPEMSIKQLKAAIDRVGYGDISCIEKKELVDLVMKLYEKHLRTSQQYSEDDLDLSSPTTETMSANSSSGSPSKAGASSSSCPTAGTSGSQSPTKSSVARSHSPSNIPVSSRSSCLARVFECLTIVLALPLEELHIHTQASKQYKALAIRAKSSAWGRLSQYAGGLRSQISLDATHKKPSSTTQEQTQDMEGYLVRIPRAAWLGESTQQHPRRPSSSSRRSCTQAQLLYYVLGEGYLKGYVAPGDDEPVDVFQLTSFHVQVDPMYSMLMFEVFASAKARGGAAAHTVDSTKKKRRSKASKGDDSSSDEDEDEGSEDEDENATKQQESSILLFTANKKLVQTWGSRLLNWNRYVFGSFGGSDDDADEPDPVALEASKQELLAAFQQHCCASWFGRPLSLKADRPKPSNAPVNRKSMTTITGGGAITKALSANPKVFGGNDHPTKPGANANGNAPPSKPWWMLNASQIRRVSSNSLHKST